MKADFQIYLPVNLSSQALSSLQKIEIIQQNINQTFVFLVGMFKLYLSYTHKERRQPCLAGKIGKERKCLHQTQNFL